MGLKVALGLLVLIVGARVSGFDRPMALVRLSDTKCGKLPYPKKVVWFSGGRAQEKSLRQSFTCKTL